MLVDCCDGKRNKTNVSRSLRLQTQPMFVFVIAMATVIKPMCDVFIAMANVLKPMLFLAYCDGTPITPMCLLIIVMANVITPFVCVVVYADCKSYKTIVVFADCDGNRHETNVVFC